MPISCVFAQNFYLSGVVAFLFAEEGAALVDLSRVAQLLGADRCPPGFLDRFTRQLFGIRVPRDTRHHPLRVHATQHRLDQRGRQAGAHTVFLITDCKPVIEVVIAVQRDCQRIVEQRRRSLCSHILVVKNSHGVALLWVKTNERSAAGQTPHRHAQGLVRAGCPHRNAAWSTPISSHNGFAPDHVACCRAAARHSVHPG